MSRRIIQTVSSWWTTAALLLVFTGIFIAIPSGEERFHSYLRVLFESTWGTALFFLLLLNLLLATIRTAIVSLSAAPPPIEVFDTVLTLPSERSSDEITASLNMKGKTVVSNETVYIKSGRWSFLPGGVFRIGMVILLFSLFISHHMRVEEEVILHEGDTVKTTSGLIGLKSISPEMNPEFMQVGEKSIFQVKKINALFESGKTNLVVGSRRPVKIGDDYFMVSHLGITQPVELIIGKKHHHLRPDLDILPPGKTAILKVPETRAILTFTLAPEKTIKKGILTGKLYNLKSPKYKIVLQKTDPPGKAVKAILSPGEVATLDNLKVSAEGFSWHVRLRRVHDPGILFLRTGLILSILGMGLLLSRFFWYRKELLITRTGKGIRVGYREEFFRKWGINRFHKIVEDLA